MPGDQMRELWRRLRYLFHHNQHEQDLADEMRLHRDLAGQARPFGNVTKLHEASRAVWILPFLELSTRTSATPCEPSAPTPLSAPRRIFWRSPEHRRQHRHLHHSQRRHAALAACRRSAAARPAWRPSFWQQPSRPSLQLAAWEQVRDHQQAFAGTLALHRDRFDLADGGESHFAEGILASGDFFRVLGVPAMRGRVFTPGDDVHGGGQAGPVAVISYGFWKRHFASDPEIAGKTIRLNRHPFTIVGVTPPWFRGLDVDTAYDVAIPIGCEPIMHPDRSALADRGWWWLQILARLRPGETVQEAEARMKALAPEVDRATLPPDVDTNMQRQYMQRTFALQPAARGFSNTGGAEYRTALFTVMAVVGLVLLIACANIANLLLARAAARQREISIRMAIGAGRRRVMRQLMSESLLLAVLGALGGLLFAVWGSRLLVRFLSKAGSELLLDTSPDLRVLAFTMSVAVLTGILFGLAPALRATSVSPNNVLKEHGRGMIAGRFGLGRALVIGQVALSLMLLVGAGLFLGTLRNLLNTDLGFTRHNVLLVEAAMAQSNIPPKQRPPVYRDIVERLRAIPGVSSASSSLLTPIGEGQWDSDVSPEGYTPKGNDDTSVYFNRISPGFFETLRTPLLLGRDFSDHDDLAAPASSSSTKLLPAASSATALPSEKRSPPKRANAVRKRSIR